MSPDADCCVFENLIVVASQTFFVQWKGKPTMSFIRKLCPVLILAAAAAVSVSAQTRAVSDNSSGTVATNPASTRDPKKTEIAKTSNATSKKSDSDNISQTSELDDSRTKAPIAAGAKPAGADKWRFVFSPYFWMAGLHGSTGGPNRTIQVDNRFKDIFSSLKFAFMGVFEAHKGKWGAQTDIEYVSIEDDKATPGPLFSNANAKLKTFVFTPEVTYRIYDNREKGSFVQVLGGTRIWHLSSDINFGAGVLPAVEINSSRNWVDGIGGLRGKAALTERFFFIGRFDVGAGGSKLTYQLFGGLGYDLNKRVALVFGYRDLNVNYNKNNFVYDMSQRGPIVGLGFKF